MCYGTIAHMTTLFQFEADFVDSLRCIPMVVRYKLDTCGVKLKLTHWNQLTVDERQYLVNAACDTDPHIRAYRDRIYQLVDHHGGDRPSELEIDPHPPWHNSQVIPDSVRLKAAECGVDLTPSHWAELTPLQRFALIKLSRSNHENRNFLPALKEFGVV